jgi:sialate O-acetylesterase
MPVCVMQMHSPDRYERNATKVDEEWARMREAQAAVMASEPRVTVVASYDFDPKLREAKHMELAMRAARWAAALVKDRNVKTGPTLRGIRPAGNTITVEFENIGKGLMAGRKEPLRPEVTPLPDTNLHGFEVAGEDGEWHEARAVIEDDKVLVTSERVTSPTRVRYAWSPTPNDANLYNRDGFPALPFREPRAARVK